MKKVYRFKYTAEVYVEAESDEEAKELYEGIQLTPGAEDIKSTPGLVNADFTETVLAECESDDYRELDIYTI